MAKNTVTKQGTGPGDKKEDAYKYTDVGIVHSGNRITLPAEPRAMDYDEAITALVRKRDEENMMIDVMEVVESFPWDGAIQFFKAMTNKFGFANVKAPRFWGDQTPTFISVPVDYGVTAEFLWGDFTLPGIEGELNCSTTVHNGRQVFCIRGSVKRKDHPAIKNLADETRRLVAEDSIYRGKPFKLFVNDGGQVDMQRYPEFLDTSRTSEEELIFSDQLADTIETNLFTPIRYTERCRANKIPLRRGVLLEGPFGVGKTLTAAITAKVTRENGWTFIIIDSVTALKTALHFAKLYAPAVIFAEDVDRALQGDRTVKMDDILNTIDGVAGKTAEIITVLTTNNVHAINKAMLRPGRLDAVISVRPPDAKATERLIRLYGRNRIDANEDISSAALKLQNRIPAVIREAVERAKLSAITHGRANDAGELVLTSRDLSVAADTLIEHINLLEQPQDRKVSPEEAVGLAVRDVIELNSAKPLAARMDNLDVQVGKIMKKFGVS